MRVHRLVIARDANHAYQRMMADAEAVLRTPGARVKVAQRVIETPEEYVMYSYPDNYQRWRGMEINKLDIDPSASLSPYAVTLLRTLVRPACNRRHVRDDR